MALVFIPALLRSLTQGQAQIEIDGQTVGEIIEALDAQFPGIKLRLCEDNRLRPTISVVVDGEISPYKLTHRLTADSKVHFLPALRGGSSTKE